MTECVLKKINIKSEIPKHSRTEFIYITENIKLMFYLLVLVLKLIRY